MSILQTIDLKKYYGTEPNITRALDGVNFSVNDGEFVAIFRRFYREEEVHEQQGVGIGLYLAREIVTRQGGYIKVVSEPGKGSEFSIMLPTK